MTTNLQGGSAKIFQFPAGGRAGVATRGDKAKAQAQLTAFGAAKAVVGDSWYHDAAIQEADRNGKQ